MHCRLTLLLRLVRARRPTTLQRHFYLIAIRLFRDAVLIGLNGVERARGCKGTCPSGRRLRSLRSRQHRASTEDSHRAAGLNTLLTELRYFNFDAGDSAPGDDADPDAPPPPPPPKDEVMEEISKVRSRGGTAGANREPLARAATSLFER